MYRFAKAAVRITGQATRQVRHGSSKIEEIYAKYIMGVKICGIVFGVAVWSYVLSKTGITLNLSPVGKVMPKERREAEE